MTVLALLLPPPPLPSLFGEDLDEEDEEGGALGLRGRAFLTISRRP